MQFKKLDVGRPATNWQKYEIVVSYEVDQSNIWEKTLYELTFQNDLDDLATAVESHNDVVEIYEHCKEVIEQRYGDDMADLPFLKMYDFRNSIYMDWSFVNTKRSELTEEDSDWYKSLQDKQLSLVLGLKKIIIDGAKYDGFDSFYLIYVPLTDSVKTQLDNFRWIEIREKHIVTEYDERLLMLLVLAAGNASDVKVPYTHKAD